MALGGSDLPFALARYWPRSASTLTMLGIKCVARVDIYEIGGSWEKDVLRACVYAGEIPRSR